ncbi:MAG: hypothetical protein U9N52_08600 [Campylobacterota bacterium]|nr:hypothetical protein [Campylobacterota bacterium]
MNEMYTMSVDIHMMGVVMMMAVILGNLLHVTMADDIRIYAKKMRQIMPIISSLMFLLLFTGTVMMAAKHLDFTIENIIMIVFNIFLIILETKRYMSLKHCNPNKENVFENYKIKATKILWIELLGTLVISIWMWMV